MSNLVTSTAMLRKVGSPLRKAILMYMADRASDDGSGIWSSKSNMAADLETSRRTVQREIKAMIEMGIVCEVGNRDCKSGFTVEYAINLDALTALDGTRDTQSPVTPCHPMGRPPVTPPRDTLSHKPPIEPSLNPPLVNQDLFPTDHPPKRKAPAKACQMPDGWVPSERNIQDAIDRNFSKQEIDNEADRFRDYCQANGKAYKNWDAGWRTWLGNARKFSRGGSTGGNTGVDETAFAARFRRTPGPDCF